VWQSHYSQGLFCPELMVAGHADDTFFQRWRDSTTIPVVLCEQPPEGIWEAQLGCPLTVCFGRSVL
jgi:hypothetical protein